jgi:uncharacterized membrane protein
MHPLRYVSICFVVFCVLITLYAYPSVPDTVVSHWNAQGEPDGTMHKLWGMFLLPTLVVVLFVLFIVLPRIDPLKQNVKKFISYYEGFIVVMLAFCTYLQALIILWNQGYIFDMVRFILPAFGCLFIYIGVLLTHTKRNWFIGIRTPWTLDNDTVWEKTHAVGGALFKLTGAITFLGIFFPLYAFWGFIGMVLVCVAVTIAYSYIIYKKQ